ncbi:GNAT family N-acetyltransferase [Paracoccus laeviglucosivorans]|uniref:Aminoglycoside 6'-N-acetyltransferase n=1 Tax=Paracoccus laeviglucosivorans TaxID=1197861 RepID=A0A521FPY5_9RHOB|nr:GNAT family N-acetyltransferase [Paracoccus laeviglucosivorans]SMO98154.1 aminoglycoside 6'-N-acetyltransferase [Paracoccus laeviglucosivorans]
MDRIGFRPVTQADLPMLGDWLRDARVSCWWRGADEQLAGIAEDLDNPAMRQWLALRDGQPIAYAQFYPAHHWNAPHFRDLPADTIAVDCFAGPDGFGQGGAWLDALARRLLTEASVLVIDPEPENLRAIRAYAKAGFSGQDVRPSEDGTMARIMTRHR